MFFLIERQQLKLVRKVNRQMSKKENVDSEYEVNDNI